MDLDYGDTSESKGPPSLEGTNKEETLSELEDDLGLDHARLDKEVVDTLATLRIPGREPDGSYPNCTALLQAVAEGYPKINPKFKDYPTALALVRANAPLAELLCSHLNKTDFARIRRLAILRAPEPKVTVSALQATSKAWESPYKGNTPFFLLTTINRMNFARRSSAVPGPYSNFVPIIQSSGTGKSRAVHELAKLVFTLPFNLRESGSGGFPPPDINLRNYLVKHGSTQENVDFYRLFLASLFTVVNNAITRFKVWDSPEELANYWCRKMARPDSGGYREHLYNGVLAKCANQPVAPQETPKDKAVKAAKTLICTINSKFKVEKDRAPYTVRLLLYFDEVHTLAATKVHSEPPRSLYYLLCAALDDLKMQDIFTIFLSTASHLGTFSPPQRGHPSFRVRDERFDPLQTPITEMPFDCHPDIVNLVNPHQYTLEELSEAGFMVKFGRPLFWTRWMHGDEEVRAGIIDFAQEKLKLVDHEITSDLNVAFAAISTRVLLEFEPIRQSAWLMEQKQVESHMRIAYSVPSHQEYMRSGNPSEPILAEAAAREMSKLTDSDIFGFVADLASNGLIGKGERGEIASRLLLTIVHDHVINALYPSSPKSYSSSIPLLLFIEYLFTDTAMSRIAVSLPDNVVDGTTFEQQFKGAHVRFSHFVKARNDAAVTTHAVFAAVARGFAFQCFDQQKDIDILIPIVLNNERLSEENVTGMFISVKNRSKKQNMNLDAAKLDFFPKNQNDKRPYVVLTMELGLDEGDESAAVKVVSTKHNPHNQNHPRYRISASGRSSATFRLITPELEGKFLQLLASQPLFSEHPRQDSMSLDALERLKPSWAPGRECYDWINDPILNLTA